MMSSAAPTLTVHHLQVSQSERIPWLCEELGIAYKLVLHKRAPVFSPQSIRDLNPLSQAPVIQDTLPSSEVITLAESSACAEYIIQKHGSGRLMLPPSHPDYVHYLYWFHFANAGFQPIVARPLAIKTGGGTMESPAGQMAEQRIGVALKLVNERLAQNSWLAGEEFTAADVMIVFSLTTMRTFAPYSLKGYGNILAYLKRVTEREGYRRARGKADKDLELMIGEDPPRQFVDLLKESGKL